MSRVIVGMLKGFGPVSGGVVSPPDSPTITVVDNQDGTGATVTINGSSVGSTNQVYTQLHGTSDWTLQNIVGGVVDPGSGSYWWKVVSSNDGGSAVSNIVFSQVTENYDNPFSLTYNKLWELFEGDPHFSEMFPVGNRVNYGVGDNREPMKALITTADVPEVALIQDGINANLMQTSSSSMVTCLYSLVINTGDFRVNTFTNKINWIVLTNLVHWKTLLTSLQWKEQAFIKNVRVRDIAIGQSPQLRARGINGWSTVWGCEIEMHFRTTDITFLE